MDLFVCVILYFTCIGRSEETLEERQTLATSITKVRRLLREEFAYDGYMEHGQEDAKMGQLSYNGCAVAYVGSIAILRPQFCETMLRAGVSWYPGRM